MEKICKVSLVAAVALCLARPFAGFELLYLLFAAAVVIFVTAIPLQGPGFKKVTLAFERTAENLIITIRDQGKGLDVSKIPDPLAPDNLLKTSGRGIFLIRSFMDEVQISPSQTGTEIKLIKRVHG